MARLGEITEERFNSSLHTTPITKLINTAMVVKIQDIGGKGVIQYKKANSNAKQRRVCSEDTADLLTEFNVDEGTTSGVSNIAITVKREDGTLYSTARPMNIAIANIIEVQADKDSATDSRIEYMNFSGKTKIFIVDETVAAIKAAANA